MFYIVDSLRPQIEDTNAVTAWLNKRGVYQDMLSFNTRKFQAFYKELSEAGQELPSGVVPFIQTEVRLRK